MTRIVVSAYRCNPYGVSEAYAGFMSAALLARETQVLLCTPRYNLPSIAQWMTEQADDALRRNLRVLTVSMPDVDARLGGIGTAVKPGFFLYDTLLYSRLRRSNHLGDGVVIWHRTPMSFRFRSSLYALGPPFMVGPIGGGLKPPTIVSDFFRKEGTLYRMRRFDDVLLSSKWWMRPLDSARVVLVACDYVRDILPARLEAKTVTVLDTGVDIPDSPPPRATGEPFTALFVGRLARYKAPTLAIESFARFLAQWEGQGRSARLVIVGDGPERAACHALVARLGIADRVELTGKLARREVEAQYEAADVFLFPSFTEATGNVYLEAMRARLPLVVTANGGGRDIPSDEAAVKIPVGAYPDMVEAFAQAVLELAADPERRRTMGDAGFRRVRDNYAWPVISKKLLEAVRQAAHQP